MKLHMGFLQFRFTNVIRHTYYTANPPEYLLNVLEIFREYFLNILKMLVVPMLLYQIFKKYLKNVL